MYIQLPSHFVRRRVYDIKVKLENLDNFKTYIGAVAFVSSCNIDKDMHLFYIQCLRTASPPHIKIHNTCLVYVQSCRYM